MGFSFLLLCWLMRHKYSILLSAPLCVCLCYPHKSLVAGKPKSFETRSSLPNTRQILEIPPPTQRTCRRSFGLSCSDLPMQQCFSVFQQILPSCPLHTAIGEIHEIERPTDSDL
ncbi:Uncharacterized protein Adt_33830 [Abeliophyllum distichum]|uniref:Secreted protein n=1 Tax=Abeliophyllum distichum TaxID=126358 RepID=A0ABD1R0Z8_9LAMI